jgi:hypothetical protein
MIKKNNPCLLKKAIYSFYCPNSNHHFILIKTESEYAMQSAYFGKVTCMNENLLNIDKINVY